MTKREKIDSLLRQHYGEAGIHAAESMCLTEDDYAQGFDHVATKIAPALEEELFAVENIECDRCTVCERLVHECQCV